MGDADTEEAPSSLDRRPARRAAIGWTLATFVGLVPAILSVVVTLAAWHAPPAGRETEGQARVGYWLGKPTLTVATPNGLTQLVGRDAYSPRSEQAVTHLSAELAITGRPLRDDETGIDVSRVSSVARSGRKLAFAFFPARSEAPVMLVVDGPDARSVPIPWPKTWLMGLRGEGDGFAGYLGQVDVDGAEGTKEEREAAFLRLAAGVVRGQVHHATIVPAGVLLGPAIDLSPFQGKWVSDVLYVNGAPVFVLASGAFRQSDGYARADGSPVALPDDAFSASVLHVGKDGGTFVRANGETRVFRRNGQPYSSPGIRLCTNAAGELEPIEESGTQGELLTTSACGHVFRMRPDAHGRYRDMQVDDGPWRPIGSGMASWWTPIADPIGDRWVVRSAERIDQSWGGVFVYDVQGRRVDPPSPTETLRALAGHPSRTFIAGVLVSWAAAIAAIALLVRAIRRLRRVRIARASPASPRPGLFTGVLEEGGRALRITLGGRVTEHVVALADDWPRRCVFSGAELSKERVQLVAVMNEPTPAPPPASFRDAAPVSLPPALAPATKPPIIGLESQAQGYVSRAFVALVVALIVSVPLPTVLLVRLGFGPY